MIRGQPAPNPSPSAYFLKIYPDRNFGIVICSEIDRRSCNKAFGVDRVLQSLEARITSYVPGEYKVFYKRGGRLNLRKGSFDWKHIVLVPF